MTDKIKKKISDGRKGKGLGNTNAKGKNLGNTNGFLKGCVPFNKGIANVTLKCGGCGSGFTTLKCYKKDGRKYCSRDCYIKNYPKGDKSISWRGGKPDCKNCGKKLSSYGYEHCDKCSRKIRPRNWKGGITPLNYKIRSSVESKLWIQSVFARDGYVCQKTGIKGGKLVAHHILNFSKYPELRFAIDNGITLSVKSHKEFHKIYGTRNNTQEQIDEFLGPNSTTTLRVSWRTKEQ